MRYGIEQWVEIKDFPSYEVNQYGEIRNAHTKRIKSCQITSDGYLKMSLRSNVDKRHHSKLVHRIVASSFYDCEDERLQVNHIDGNKKNNNLSNLEFVTGSENVQHAYSTGIRGPSGGRGPIRKIKILETGEIFNNMHDCARAIGGDSGNVSRCVNGRINTYKGVHIIALEE